MEKLDFYTIPFDTETTGVDFTRSQVIQVGALFCDKNLNVIHEQEWNINYQPEKFDWSTSAEKVHGISMEDALVHGFGADDFIHEFETLQKHLYGKNVHPKNIRLVGAQSYFDYVMSQNSIWGQYGKKAPFSHRLIDTNCIGSLLYGSDTLDKNMKYFDISIDDSKRHSALYDAQKHFEVFHKQVCGIFKR